MNQEKLLSSRDLKKFNSYLDKNGKNYLFPIKINEKNYNGRTSYFKERALSSETLRKILNGKKVSSNSLKIFKSHANELIKQSKKIKGGANQVRDKSDGQKNISQSLNNEKTSNIQSTDPFDNEENIIIRAGYYYFLFDTCSVLTKFFKFNSDQKFKEVKNERDENKRFLKSFEKAFEVESIQFVRKYFDDIKLDIKIDSDGGKSWISKLRDNVNNFKNQFIESLFSLKQREKKLIGVFLIGYFIGTAYFRKRFEILSIKEFNEKYCDVIHENGWISNSGRKEKINNGDEIDICFYCLNSILDCPEYWLKSFDEFLSPQELKEFSEKLKGVKLEKNEKSLKYLRKIVIESKILPKL